MPKKEIIEEVLSGSQNRRSLLKKLGIASAALGASAVVGQKELKAQSAPSAVDVVQFALNLEYLEAEFYSVATTGQTLEARGNDFGGTPTTTSYGRVNFANSAILTGQVAQFIAADELNHVLLLRSALSGLGITPVSKPNINLDALASLGASLENEMSFLVLSRIFEDIGVSAYAGGSTYLSGEVLQIAARILAVEGEHVANVRLQIARLGIQTAGLDGADVLPPPSGTNFFSTNVANGLCAVRTPGEVLYLAYGVALGGSLNGGGFFPEGVNGNIKTATNAATSANLGLSPM
jgi:hypothetical protein